MKWITANGASLKKSVLNLKPELIRALLQAQREKAHPTVEARLLQEMCPLKERSGRQHAGRPLHLRLLDGVIFGATDCWHWRRPRNAFGYGRITYQGRMQVVHRLAYEVWKGPIPDGMSVLHSCDNPSCINPEHLRLGTYSDNIKDAYARGRRTFKGKLCTTRN